MNPLKGRFWGLAAFVAILSALTGCASFTVGEKQTVKIETLTPAGDPIPGAQCRLNNDKATANTSSGRNVVVRRSSDNLMVLCTMAGQPAASGQAVSRANIGVWGNAVFGGLIGTAIDLGSGSGYTYPTWIRLVFGEDRLFDRRADREDGPVLGSVIGKLEREDGAPGVAVAAPGASVAPANPPLSITLKEGDALEYTLTDALAGTRKQVSYRLERIEPGMPGGEAALIFNGASRIERADGRVVFIDVPEGGYFDSSSPPGGWGRKDLKPDMQWHTAYDALSGGKLRHALDARVVGERKVVVGGVELAVFEIAYTGWIQAPAGGGSAAAWAPFEANVLYAPALGRTVKFDARHRQTGGTVLARQSMELVRVPR